MCWTHCPAWCSRPTIAQWVVCWAHCPAWCSRATIAQWVVCWAHCPAWSSRATIVQWVVCWAHCPAWCSRATIAQWVVCWAHCPAWCSRATIAQWVVCWAHCPTWCSITGSTLLCASHRGDFSLGVKKVRAPFPKNSFGWEYKLRCCLCTHTFHHMDSKDPDIHVLPRWMLQEKHTQHAPKHGKPQRYSREDRTRRPVRSGRGDTRPTSHTLAAILLSAWQYWFSTGIGWPGVCMLWLGEMASLVSSFYVSVAACRMVWADPSLRSTVPVAGAFCSQ